MICRVVVGATVAVVTTVVGSVVVSIVVSVVVRPAAWTLPTTATASRIPATRQTASPATCSDFLTRRTYGSSVDAGITRAG
jgi:hypothetical protein